MGLHIDALVAKDLRILFRDRTGMVLLFLMPAMFLLVMSVALRDVFAVGTRSRPLDLPVVVLDRGVPLPQGGDLNLADRVLEDLQAQEGLTVLPNTATSWSEAEALVTEGTYPVVLVLPPDFTQSLMAGKPARAVLFVDPSAPAAVRTALKGMVAAVLGRVALEMQVTQALMTMQGASPENTALRVTLLRRLTQARQGEVPITVEERAPETFAASARPDAVQHNVPAYTVFGLFFIATVMARSLLDERRQGTFLRLQAAPLSRTAFLLGKTLPYFLVNLIQVAALFALGVAVFRLSLGHSPGGLVLVSVATAAAATSLGLLVATLGRTENQVTGLATLLSLVLAALGGVMVPVYVMPRGMQALARLSPHFWSLQAYQDLIVRGLGVRDVLPEVGILLAFAAGCAALAVRMFPGFGEGSGPKSPR